MCIRDSFVRSPDFSRSSRFTPHLSSSSCQLILLSSMGWSVPYTHLADSSVTTSRLSPTPSRSSPVRSGRIRATSPTVAWCRKSKSSKGCSMQANKSSWRPMPDARVNLSSYTSTIIRAAPLLSCACGSAPVSYTHLDVYKRQTFSILHE